MLTPYEHPSAGGLTGAAVAGPTLDSRFSVTSVCLSILPVAVIRAAQGLPHSSFATHQRHNPR